MEYCQAYTSSHTLIFGALGYVPLESDQPSIGTKYCTIPRGNRQHSCYVTVTVTVTVILILPECMGGASASIGAGRTGFNSREAQKSFSSQSRPTYFVSHQGIPSNRYWGPFSWGKQVDRRVKLTTHIHLSDEVKNTWSLTSTEGNNSSHRYGYTLYGVARYGYNVTGLHCYGHLFADSVVPSSEGN